MTDDIRERLYSRTKKVEGPLPTLCVVWTGDTRVGYGRISWNGKRQGTHRVAYELEIGPIPKGMCILHHCDVPNCLETDHMWCDTNKANNDDKVRKGRQAKGSGFLREREAGEVLWLALHGHSPTAIGRRYKISPPAVRKIRDGKIWRGLKPIEPEKPKTLATSGLRRI
jgi:hypothetical protein